jgi:dihydropteroate synthase
MKSAAESKVFSRNYSLNIRGRLLDLKTPKVMGILNLTPDSFYAGSRFRKEKEILNAAEKMIHDGAAILDLGGSSTRPGAQPISVKDEMDRVLPAIQSIGRNFPEIVISCDTYQSEVAVAAVGEGASMINDVSGGELDKKMFKVVSQLGVPYVLMHMRGTPQTMAALNNYENLNLEIILSLQQRVKQLEAYGVKDIVVDPGFGFSKSPGQGFDLLNNLELMHRLDRPLLVGISRKSMVWKTLGIDAERALNGTTVLNSIALMKGTSILRVHDVREAVEAVKLIEMLQK